MDLRFVDRNDRQDVKELDRSVKNRFNWAWLEEKDCNGDFLSDYIRKMPEAGVAWCISFFFHAKLRLCTAVVERRSFTFMLRTLRTVKLDGQLNVLSHCQLLLLPPKKWKTAQRNH
ncbi:hypothetical protein ElyMa_003349700 [Elysia marginata]|uniref:Uncharacterized protein n=1 Tax=Elysia marginata TaxID=1093978 RepID=A0AAV4JJI8_9GAST|nr:hypothetical protein ElyMa_003349700 [Elysia marginata]